MFSASVLRKLLFLARLLWGLLFALCAFFLSPLVLDPHHKFGPDDQYYFVLPGLGTMGIVVLAPFLLLLRGKISFLPMALAALALAAGVSTYFSVKEFTGLPYRISDGTPLQFALSDAPISAFIFAFASLLAWGISKLGPLFQSQS